MEYRNTQPPEGINVSHTHPLKELVLLLGGAILIIVVLSLVLSHSMGYLARFIPFEKEVALTRDLDLGSETPPALQRYLDALTARIGRAMELPPGMRLQVHYSNDATLNAFSTLGGHLMLYRGLLEKMPNENTLAMLIAHEVAHVKHRDPIRAIGSGAALQILLALTIGRTNADVLANAGSFTLLSFTREMESAADAAALQTLDRLYGHVGGATRLFEVINKARDGMELPAFFSTHPLDEQRIRALREMATANGWPLKGPLTPLPAGYRGWLATRSP